MAHGILASGDLALGRCSADTESDCFSGAITLCSVGEFQRLLLDEFEPPEGLL
jgi:hypothetical protein